MVWLNSLHVIRAHQGALAFCGPVSSIAEHSHAPSCIAEQTAFIPFMITDLFYNIAPAPHSRRVGCLLLHTAAPRVQQHELAPVPVDDGEPPAPPHS